MRKIIISLLSVALIGCASNEKEPKNELENQENTANNLESNEVYDVVDYNDGLLAEITLLDVKLAQLLDFDEKNVSEEEMTKAINNALAEQEKVVKGLEEVTPFGVGGQEFKDAALRYAMDTKEMFDVYKEFEGKFHIPDEEWTEEDANAWSDKYNAAYDIYAAAYDNFEEVQQSYADKNDITLEYTVDPEEIYEESIQPQEEEEPEM